MTRGAPRRSPCAVAAALLLAGATAAPRPAVATTLGGIAAWTEEAAGGFFAERWSEEVIALRFLERDGPVASADALLGVPVSLSFTPLLLAGIHDEQASADQTLHAGLGARWIDSEGMRLTAKAAYLRRRDGEVTRDNEEGWLGRIEASRGGLEVVMEGGQTWGALARSHRVAGRLDIDFARRGGMKLGYANARVAYEREDGGGSDAIEADLRAVAWGFAGTFELRERPGEGTESLEVSAAWDWWRGPSPPFRPPTLIEYLDRLSATGPPEPILLLTPEEIEERPFGPPGPRVVSLGARYRKDVAFDEETLSFLVGVHGGGFDGPPVEIFLEYSEKARPESFFEGVERTWGGGVGFHLGAPRGPVLLARYRTRGEEGTISAGAEDVFLFAVAAPVSP